MITNEIESELLLLDQNIKEKDEEIRSRHFPNIPPEVFGPLADFLRAICPLSSLEGVCLKFAQNTVRRIADDVDSWFLFAGLEDSGLEDMLREHFRKNQVANTLVGKIKDGFKPENNLKN